MLKNQTTFLADDNLDGEKLDLIFIFNTFCLIVTAVGEAMVTYYIARHAPKERPINKLVLIDQVCKTHKEFTYCNTVVEMKRIFSKLTCKIYD